MWQAAVLGIAACTILAASTVACSRQSAIQPLEEDTSLAGRSSGFYIPEAGSLVLMLGADGWLEPIAGSAEVQVPGQSIGRNPGLSQGPGQAPFAIQTAIAAIQAPIDGGAIIAINRRGLVHLTVQDRHVQLRRIDGATAEFAGRSVAQAWTWDDKAMFLLHRNEIFEPEAARIPTGLVIAANADGVVAFPGFKPDTETIDPEESDLYGAPYALFPRANDHWLMQFRLVGPERTRTAFAAWNPDQNQLEPLERNSYETAVRPGPITEAPVALRLAAETLGGSLIMDASMPDGSLQTWLRGNPDTILAVRALVSDTRVISLASDGRLIIIVADTVHESHIDQPVPQAYFRDLTLLDGFIFAVWEEDFFPDIGRSGLVIMDASRLTSGSSQLKVQTSQPTVQPSKSPGQ